MFPSHQLATTLRNDREIRLRKAATKRRLVRRNKVPPVKPSLASVLTVVWPDAECPVSDQRAHYVT
jgi:hypothetical protein